MTAKTLLTVEDFAAIPEGDGPRFELVEGELVQMSSATVRHNRVRDRLLVSLEVFLSARKLGFVVSEVDCRTGDASVRRPDLSFFSRDRWDSAYLDRLPVPFAPDIAVEILSPSESALDVTAKALEYLRAGTVEVWIFDLANEEIVIRGANSIRALHAGDQLETLLLPGFSVPVSEAIRVPE